MKTATPMIEDDSFLILINAYHEGVEFTLPEPPNGNPMEVRHADGEDRGSRSQRKNSETKVIVGGRSLVLLSDGE